MRTAGKILLCMVSFVILTGCQSLSRTTIYSLDDNNIEFSLPKSWSQIDSNENDLALTKTDAELTLNTYRQSELNGLSAYQLLEDKIQEKMSDMTDYSVVKKYNMNETQDRKIYSKLYTASKDGVEKQYYFNVMEFTGTHTYVYALYEAKETYMKYNIDDIQRLLIRMKWNGEEDLALR